VIQRLFATSRSGIAQAVADLDETIHQIGSAIFAMRSPRGGRRAPREQVLSLAAEAGASLGFEPHLHLDGPIDQGVPEQVGAHMLAVLREALSNVVRHARATTVEVTVRAITGADLVVSVTDDGVGVVAPARPAGRGMENMTRRAQALGGEIRVEPGPAGKGTTVTWRVPLESPAAP